jgi:hypothetical protein
MDDAVALAYAVVALQSSSGEFNCASIDAVLAGAAAGIATTATRNDRATAAREQANNSPVDRQSMTTNGYAGDPAERPLKLAAASTSTDSAADDHDSYQGLTGYQDLTAHEGSIIRSRERNREHARKTRLRKKAHLETLRYRVKALEAQRVQLRQQIEKCSIASILLGLSGETNDDVLEEDDDDTKQLLAKNHQQAHKIALLTGTKRKRFVSDALGDDSPEQAYWHVDIGGGQTKLIGSGKSHINWKTGVYSDVDGSSSKLTKEQLETVR